MQNFALPLLCSALLRLCLASYRNTRLCRCSVPPRNASPLPRGAVPRRALAFAARNDATLYPALPLLCKALPRLASPLHYFATPYLAFALLNASLLNVALALQLQVLRYYALAMLDYG